MVRGPKREKDHPCPPIFVFFVPSRILAPLDQSLAMKREKQAAYHATFVTAVAPSGALDEPPPDKLIRAPSPSVDPRIPSAAPLSGGGGGSPPPVRLRGGPWTRVPAPR